MVVALKNQGQKIKHPPVHQRLLSLTSSPSWGVPAGATKCTFELAAHQIRIHRSQGCSFSLRVASNPIIEHSRDLEFGPLATTDEEAQVRQMGCVAAWPCICGRPVCLPLSSSSNPCTPSLLTRCWRSRGCSTRTAGRACKTLAGSRPGHRPTGELASRNLRAICDPRRIDRLRIAPTAHNVPKQPYLFHLNILKLAKRI